MTESVTRDPSLREAAVCAEAALRLQAAKDYGFVTGGPEIVVDRCESAIAAAREAGITYTDDEIDVAIATLVREAAAA